MTTILVTGSAGFIGFHVCQKLLQTGYKVVGLDNLNDYYPPQLKIARNQLLQQQTNYSFYQIDLANFSKLQTLFQEKHFDKICHLAAQAGVRYSLSNPWAYVQSNLVGFVNLLECVRKSNCQEVVYASSSSVYGNETMPKGGFIETQAVNKPASLYAATKRADELLAYTYHNLYKINLRGLRFFSVYGPWGRPDMAYFLFSKAILAKQPIPLYNYGKMQRDFTYIDDIVDGVIQALKRPFTLDLINLGNSQPIKLQFLIKVLEQELGQKAILEYQPMQPGEVLSTHANINLAQKILDFAPKTKIEIGLKTFINWYKSYYRLN